MEALRLRTPDLAQELDLLGPLHALAHRLDAEAGRHSRQLGQYDPGFLAVVKLLHEAHIQLDQVEVDALQHIQRGIPAAKVVLHTWKPSF